MNCTSGTRLGSYEILSPLGSGGMGAVYRAMDHRLRREVAIKILPGLHAHDPDRRIRFEREARLLAALNHPNIGAIYDLQQFEHVHFLVLELVSGETLAQKIRSGPLPLERVLKYARQLAGALKAAHEKGIIHRDLKPSNIQVTPEDTIKVLDFGLAKEFEGDLSPMSGSSDTTTLTTEKTEAGALLGTPTYMSPEQTRGQPLDQRTDIWSFGCCCYEMLCGQKAFDGTTFPDKVAAILSREPDWGSIPPGTPGSIIELLHRCLEKDVEKRPSNFHEVEILLSSRAVAASPSMAVKPRLNRKRFAAIGLVALAIIIAVIGLVIRSQIIIRGAIPEQKFLAVFPFRDMSGQSSNQPFADGLAETVSARLTEVPDLQVMPPVATRSLSDDDFPHIAQDLGANLVLRGTVQRSGNQIRITYALLNTRRRIQIAADTVTGSVDDLFTVEDELADSVVAALRVHVEKKSDGARRTGLETAAAHDNYLKALGYLQRFENESSVDAAIALLTETSKSGSASALVEAALGRAYLAKYDLTHDRSWADLAILACDRAVQLGGQFPEVLVTLGQLRLDTGHAGEAIVEYQRALTFQPNLPEAVLGLADAYAESRKLQEAEQTYRRAIALRPEYWSGYNKVGKFYVEHGRFPEALEMFRKVIQLTPDNARGYYNLGVALQLSNRLDDARAAYQKSISLRPSGDACSNLGTLEFYLGQYKAAAEAYKKATSLAPRKSTYWANLGDAYRWTSGMADNARAAYERAIQLALSELQVNSEDAFVRVTLALCYAKTDKVIDAQKQIRRALILDPKNTETIYQAAVVALLCGKRKEAIQWIQKAMEGGYNITAVTHDPEFKGLQKAKDFQEALTKTRTVGPSKGN